MKRILIIRTDRLGDMVLTLPMAAVLRKETPDSTVIFGIREYTKPIVERSPDVDEILTIDTESSVSSIAKLLKATRADVVLIPSPTFKLALASFLARIPTRVGTGYRWYSLLFTKKIFEHRRTALRNEAEYNIKMLESLGIKIETYPLPNILIDSEKSDTRYAVIHLFTGGSAQVWGVNNFKEFARYLARVHSLEIYLTGENTHREFLLTVAQELKPFGVRAHIHTETLVELAQLLKDAKLVISASTGPGHLAAALGAPTIGLFQLATPLSKERWGFRGMKVINIEPLSAPRPECPACKDCSCMDNITVNQAAQAAAQLIENDT